MEDKDKWKFELVVHGISEKNADRILDLINEIVGLSGGKVSGGFVKDEEDRDEKPESV